MIRILSLDLSFQKTGWAISDVEGNNVQLIASGLFTSDKKLKTNQRIKEHIEDIIKIYNLYKPDIIIKEAAIMGRSSTGLNVIKTHGAFEYFCSLNNIPVDDVHNQSIKAWARRTIKNHQEYNKKEIVAHAVEKYYNKKIESIWTPRGRLIDDTADAIALPIVWLIKMVA